MGGHRDAEPVPRGEAMPLLSAAGGGRGPRGLAAVYARRVAGEANCVSLRILPSGKFSLVQTKFRPRVGATFAGRGVVAAAVAGGDGGGRAHVRLRTGRRGLQGPFRYPDQTRPQS